MSVFSRCALRLAALLAVAVAAMQPAPAAAQYFGRNQVLYQRFDFRILRTEHFDVYYYPEEERAARDAARYAERWYARLSRVMDYEFENRQPLILYASSPHFQQNTIIGEPGEGTGGVTEVFKQRIVLPFGGTVQETDHVIGHELVHAFQYDVTGVGRAGAGLDQAASRFQLPLWFIEGMAEYLSVGPVDPHTSMWLRDAALSGRLPTLQQLTYDPRFFPYRWGQAFWAYVGGRWGDAAVGQVLKQAGQGVPYPEAFHRILNVELEDLVDDWHASIRRTYLPLLSERREAREEARPLVTGRGRGGSYNVGPAVSPDGSQVVFLSSLDELDVHLYLANAETGEVVRRLIKGSAFDPHFGSLRFINSAGAWSPDGTRFALAALRRDRDVVVVMQMPSGRILREYRIPGVSEISGPTWSADGRSVIFAGNKGGITDIWLVDTETGAAQQLTDDPYGDMQPSVSPDGRTIAFATERGVPLDSLRYQQDIRIAFMDLASREVRIAQGTGRGKNINPQWTPDGSGIYFVSDRSGIPNVYRLGVQDGALTQVTNLFTGVSGITAFSPAISSALKADRLVFTAYERNNYNLYGINNPAELRGIAPVEPQLGPDGHPLAAVLPPSPRPAEPAFNRVASALADSRTGLIPEGSAGAIPAVPYRPRLSLDYLGQPTFGASVSSGPYSRGGIYGGVGGIFSDVLGRHTVYGTVQAQGDVEEIGFSAAYINRARRLNFGLAAQRVPYIAAGRAIEQVGDEVRDQLLIYRLFDTSLGVIGQYPISRQQRVEFSLGARRITQDIKIREYVYTGGGVFYRERTEDDLPSYNLGEAAAALVYDNSYFGYTSPFAGQRYRFELAPTLGTLQFTTATADFRKYFFLRPMTFAVRGLHFGRYGRDESRLNPLFVGYPSIMRGYSYGSIRNSCQDALNEEASGGFDVPGDPQECRVLSQLFGSRIGAINSELRLPLIRPTSGSAGIPPVEGIAFFDAGAAWGDILMRDGSIVETSPNWRVGLPEHDNDRGIFTAAGVGARVNLFGYFVLEAVYVNALQRKNGWHWELALQPGF